MRRRLEEARPDVLVMFSNDHLLNWPINNVPEYTVGIAEAHVGPADWFDEWLGMEKYRVPGHTDLARFIVNEGARRRLALAWLGDEMQFDDGISVPTHYLNPDARFRLVPVTMNCTMPPIPTPARAYEVGRTMRDILRPSLGASASRSSPPAVSRTNPAARATSGWTRSSTAGSSICSSAATTTRCCASARSSGWRPRAPAAPPSCWPGSWSSRSRAGPADVLAYMPAIAWRSGTGMVVWNEMRLTSPDHAQARRQQVHHEWNNALAPRLTIDPGDTVVFDTRDAVGSLLLPQHPRTPTSWRAGRSAAIRSPDRSRCAAPRRATPS